VRGGGRGDSGDTNEAQCSNGRADLDPLQNYSV
jgi:hypothetical protein